jgi:hypothetical protein
MAKVTGQSVPPELVTLWNQLTAPAKNSQGANGSMRASKIAKKPRRPPRKNLDLIAFQDIARNVEKIHFKNLGKAAPANFVFAMTRDLILGVVDAKYFQTCTVDSTVSFEAVPTNIVRNPQPPYSYRLTGMLSTKPTYPAGTLGSAGAWYEGNASTIDGNGVFVDTLWRWKKRVFDAEALDETEPDKKILMVWDCTIQINTSTRASRTMLSLVMTAHKATAGTAECVSPGPPLIKPKSFYWRFKVPPTSAPYYHSSQVRKVVLPMARMIKKTTDTIDLRYALTYGNRPMLGRGFNNNTDVQTAFTGDPVLWEIKPPCLPYEFADGDSWKWHPPTGEKWSVSIQSKSFFAHISGVTTIQLVLHFTLNGVSHDVTHQQSMSGVWRLNTESSTGISEDLRVVDISCIGDAALIHVALATNDFRRAARGFFTVRIVDENTVYFQTEADADECLKIEQTTETKDYGEAGIQIWHIFSEPKTVWMWFDNLDNVSPTKNQADWQSDYPYTTALYTMQLTINGSPVSIFTQVRATGNAYSANVDGYNDAGRFSGGDVGSMNHREAPGVDALYFASVGQHADETNYPASNFRLVPLAIAPKKIAFTLEMFRFIEVPGQTNPELFKPPSYTISITYTGKIISADGTYSPPSKTVIDP